MSTQHYPSKYGSIVISARSKNRPSNLLANFVAMLHLVIVIFFATGWILPSPIAWWIIILGGFGLQLIWLFYKNRCPLTVLENRLREGPVRPDHDDNSPLKERPHFVANLLSRFFGFPVSRTWGDVIVYSVLYISMTLSAWRLFG